MKKTYIQPETKVVCTSQTVMQATSTLLFDNNSDNALEESEILVKEDRGGFWDDEW